MKPSIPKGTRDFAPGEVIRREYIFSTMRRVFRQFGFEPIETPSMENLTTLTGKYGDEGDQLLFKVLNNGDFLAKADEKALAEKDSNALIYSISKRGLRYDLTVPFARYVAMHQNDISFPFKRYAIQPVWRADRPQKGRYQEFYQCDVDAVGSESLLYEADCIQIYDQVFSQLKIPVVIRLNHRKLLLGITEYFNLADQFVQFTTRLDKLDKIGKDKVSILMSELGLSEGQIRELWSILDAPLDQLGNLVGNENTVSAVNDLSEILSFLDEVSIQNQIRVDFTLARGLGYYTGCVIEVNALQFKIGSIGGGGRYEDLTGIFGLQDVPGVGISFGAERIFDIMVAENLFPDGLDHQLDCILLGLDQPAIKHAFQLAAEMRKHGLSVDIYPRAAKMKKQLKYVDQKNVPYAIIIGGDEMQAKIYTFKNMLSGKQESLTLQAIIDQLKSIQS